MIPNLSKAWLVLYCVYVEMEWLYGNPEQGYSEALATWTSVQVSFTAPLFCFLPACFNFVIACWLYCFNVDVFVLFLYLVKSSRELMFLIVYITCRIEIKFYLLTYLLKLPIIINTVMWGLAFVRVGLCEGWPFTQIWIILAWPHHWLR